eukprot:1003381_1
MIWHCNNASDMSLYSVSIILDVVLGVQVKVYIDVVLSTPLRWQEVQEVQGNSVQEVQGYSVQEAHVYSVRVNVANVRCIQVATADKTFTIKRGMEPKEYFEGDGITFRDIAIGFVEKIPDTKMENTPLTKRE